MNENQPSRPFLLLGMHRSGTSFLASLLQDWGVFIGDRLYEPGLGNVHGHFEDLDLIEFHRQAVLSRQPGRTPIFDEDMILEADFQFQPTPEEEAEARKILAERSRPGYWGWKEPRTCLFVDFWLERMPGVRCLVVYRHPLEVYYSMLRRRQWDVIFNPELIFKTYIIYNAKILRAIECSPGQFLVINANAAFARLPALNKLLQDTYRFPPPPEQLKTPFEAKEFKSLPINAARHHLFQRVCPEAAASFAAMQKVAAIPYDFTSAKMEPADEAALRRMEEALDRSLAGQPPDDKMSCWPWLECACMGVPPGEMGALKKKIAAEAREMRNFSAVLKTKFDEVWQDACRRVELEKEQSDLIKQLYAEVDKFAEGHERWTKYTEDLKKTIADLEARCQQLSARLPDAKSAPPP